MEKKIALSIEQMKYLESLGLDTSDASIYYDCEELCLGTIKHPLKVFDMEDYFNLQEFRDEFKKDNEGQTIYPKEEVDIIPAYTLQDILKKIPCSIEEDEIGRFDYNLRVTMMCDEDGYLSYETDPSEIHDSENNPLVLHETECKNILDSAFDMLLWCIENNYIKTNKV